MIAKMIFKIILNMKIRPKISFNILLKFFLCLTSVNYESKLYTLGSS